MTCSSGTVGHIQKRVADTGGDVAPALSAAGYNTVGTGRLKSFLGLNDIDKSDRYADDELRPDFSRPVVNRL